MDNRWQDSGNSRKPRRGTRFRFERAAASLVAAMLLGAGAVSRAGVEVVSQHAGGGDPVSEGFDDVGGGGVVQPRQSNTTWQINTAGTDARYYQRRHGGGMTSLLLTDGWYLEARIERDPTAPAADPVDAGTLVQWGTGSTRYIMTFGAVDDGLGNARTVVRVVDGVSDPSFTTGTPGFHTFRLEDRDGDGDADLFVDGLPRISHYPGLAGSADAHGPLFGDGSSLSGDSANMFYSRVALYQNAIPRLDALTVSEAGQVVLGWHSVSGRIYTVSSAADAAANFDPVAIGIVASGPSTAFTNGPPTGTQVYRVERAP